jgi:hypothetical protein
LPQALQLELLLQQLQLLRAEPVSQAHQSPLLRLHRLVASEPTEPRCRPPTQIVLEPTRQTLLASQIHSFFSSKPLFVRDTNMETLETEAAPVSFLCFQYWQGDKSTTISL